MKKRKNKGWILLSASRMSLSPAFIDSSYPPPPRPLCLPALLRYASPVPRSIDLLPWDQYAHVYNCAGSKAYPLQNRRFLLKMGKSLQKKQISFVRRGVCDLTLPPSPRNNHDSRRAVSDTRRRLVLHGRAKTRSAFNSPPNLRRALRGGGSGSLSHPARGFGSKKNSSPPVLSSLIN